MKCIDLDVNTPLDYNTALTQLKNNNNLYYMILCRFRNQNMLPVINQVSAAMDAFNWNKFRELAHSLKGSSGYVGAGQIQYDCFYIQDFHYKGQIDQMRERYSRLMENVISFIIYSKQYLET